LALGKAFLFEIFCIVEDFVQKPKVVFGFVLGIRMNDFEVDIEEVLGQFAFVHLK